MKKDIGNNVCIVFVLLASVLIAGNVSAALPPPSANFEIDFSQLNLPEGNWEMSIISIPKYETKSYQEIFTTIQNDYKSIKELCGIPDYLEIEVNPTQTEILELQSIYPAYEHAEIGRGHYGEYDEVYYFLTDEKYKECVTATGYGSYNDLDKILEDKYKIITNFWINHYFKSVQLHQEGVDLRAFYPTHCEINDSKCVVYIEEGMEGPYFVVLEKMNSKDEIYFSGPVDINWEAQGDVEWKWDMPNNYTLKINQLEFSDSNSLIINFEGSNSSHGSYTNSNITNVTYGQCVTQKAIVKNTCFASAKNAKETCKVPAKEAKSKEALKQCRITYRDTKKQCKVAFKLGKEECRSIED